MLIKWTSHLDMSLTLRSSHYANTCAYIFVIYGLLRPPCGHAQYSKLYCTAITTDTNQQLNCITCIALTEGLAMVKILITTIDVSKLLSLFSASLKHRGYKFKSRYFWLDYNGYVCGSCDLCTVLPKHIPMF